jgi:hypothetical protein
MKYPRFIGELALEQIHHGQPLGFRMMLDMAEQRIEKRKDE